MSTCTVVMVCPVLEPGASGVGDYASALSRALSGLGVRPVLVSLAEDFPEDVRTQWDHLPTLRLSRVLPLRRKVAEVHQFLASLEAKDAPASLQYVPYGYDPKGLPWGIGEMLDAAFSGGVMHVMFHEPWIGWAGGSLRGRLIGLLQRSIAVNLVEKLKPRVVHTHARVYVELLRRHGIRAGQLPLFSNIDVRTPGPEEMEPASLAGLWGTDDAQERVRLLLFGRLYPDWNAALSIERMSGILQKAGRRGVFVAAGHLGECEGQLRAAFHRMNPACLGVVRGVVHEDEAGRLLRSAHYGVTTSPPDLIEKSAAAAAMFGHGLPVLCTRPSVLRGVAWAGRIPRHPLALWGEELDDFPDHRRHAPVRNGASAVARQMLKDLGIGS